MLLLTGKQLADSSCGAHNVYCPVLQVCHGIDVRSSSVQSLSYKEEKTGYRPIVEIAGGWNNSRLLEQ